jgi:hypothetical protein
MTGLIYPFPQRVLPSAAAEATGAAPVPAPVACSSCASRTSRAGRLSCA